MSNQILMRIRTLSLIILFSFLFLSCNKDSSDKYDSTLKLRTLLYEHDTIYIKINHNFGDAVPSIRNEDLIKVYKNSDTISSSILLTKYDTAIPIKGGFSYVIANKSLILDSMKEKELETFIENIFENILNPQISDPCLGCGGGSYDILSSDSTISLKSYFSHNELNSLDSSYNQVLKNIYAVRKTKMKIKFKGKLHNWGTGGRY